MLIKAFPYIKWSWVIKKNNILLHMNVEYLPNEQTYVIDNEMK